MLFQAEQFINYITQVFYLGAHIEGGGGALKKIAPSRGRREHFRGISCEKSLFYAKKS
jgi:hypothetical protein